ncbi:transmembrane protein 256 homolog [Branchiostoma floridae x Branchiostoma japonicum]
MAAVGPELFVRIAGVSGALAVALGAYGAHAFRGDVGEKKTFDTGNRYHLLHSLALLAVPLTRRPLLVGSLLASGTLLFSGGCYLSSLLEMRSAARITPIGGMLLIAGWLCIAL